MGLHESGLFFCKHGNGFHTNKLPSGVRCYRVVKENGDVVEVFRKKVFYLEGGTTLEVELLDGDFRLFRYEPICSRLVEVDSFI